MADRDRFIWYDGKLVPWRSATTHVLTHSLHYGLAVFEGVRAYKTVEGTAIFRLRDHTERLFNSAHIYMMKITYGRSRSTARKRWGCPRSARPCTSQSPPGPGAPISARRRSRKASGSRPRPMPATTST